MKPFRATYQNLNYRGEPVGDPVEVLVIKLIPSQTQDIDAEAIFVFPDGRLGQDEISMLSHVKIAWPHD